MYLLPNELLIKIADEVHAADYLNLLLTAKLFSTIKLEAPQNEAVAGEVYIINASRTFATTVKSRLELLAKLERIFQDEWVPRCVSTIGWIKRQLSCSVDSAMPEHFYLLDGELFDGESSDMWYSHKHFSLGGSGVVKINEKGRTRFARDMFGGNFRRHPARRKGEDALLDLFAKRFDWDGPVPNAGISVSVSFCRNFYDIADIFVTDI